MNWDLMPKELVKQGAEALVYKTTFIHPSNPCLLKFRPTKPYRHPILDARLTKHRCLSEARLLVKCRSVGVPCPAVYYLEEDAGVIVMEWIEGCSVRDALDNALHEMEKSQISQSNHTLMGLMNAIGKVVALLHNMNIVHGDLTTSNIMLRTAEQVSNDKKALQQHDVILIDFGLGFVSSTEEDKAVDLYVLERAFISTHPKAENLFQHLITAYAEHCKSSKTVMKRLQEVRLRGRKRSMLG